jgi:hypothetical protein
VSFLLFRSVFFFPFLPRAPKHTHTHKRTFPLPKVLSPTSAARPLSRRAPARISEAEAELRSTRTARGVVEEIAVEGSEESEVFFFLPKTTPPPAPSSSPSAPFSSPSSTTRFVIAVETGMPEEALTTSKGDAGGVITPRRWLRWRRGPPLVSLPPSSASPPLLRPCTAKIVDPRGSSARDTSTAALTSPPPLPRRSSTNASAPCERIWRSALAVSGAARALNEARRR